MTNSTEQKVNSTENGSLGQTDDVVCFDYEQDGVTGEKRLEFEDIIEDLGSFGHWQRVIFVLISLADIYGALAMLTPVFTGATPKRYCTNFTLQDGSRVPAGDPNNTWDVCESDTDNWTCVQQRFHDDFTSIVSQWDLVCKREYVSDLITSIQMCGLLVGAATFGQMSDLLGRKKSYYLAYLVMISVGFGSAFSPSWEVYAACRFVVGVGFGGAMVVNCVYPLEFVGQRWRTLCGTVGFWAVGIMLLSLLAYFVRDWRHLIMITTATGFLYFVTWWFVPESPRWLIQKGRFEEAEAIVTKIAQKNNKPVPDISILKHFAEEDRKWENKLKKYTYWDLFRVRKYCKITLAMICIWFTTFLMYYELSYNMRNLAGDRYLNMFLSGLVDQAAMLSVILFNNWLGRKKTQCLYLSVALISNLCILFIQVSGKYDDLPNVVLVFALLGKASAMAGTYVVQILSAELYPTVVRNLGVGVGSVSARIGGIVAPQIVFLGSYYGLVPYVICIILTAACFPLLLLVDETNGKPLVDKFDDGKQHKQSTDNQPTVTSFLNSKSNV